MNCLDIYFLNDDILNNVQIADWQIKKSEQVISYGCAYGLAGAQFPLFMLDS